MPMKKKATLRKPKKLEKTVAPTMIHGVHIKNGTITVRKNGGSSKLEY